jgi:phosphate starvation-inducible protein PhoH
MTLVYLAELSFKIPTRKARGLVTTIKIFEVVADIYAVYPFEDVVVFQQEVAQEVDRLALIEYPIR